MHFLMLARVWLPLIVVFNLCVGDGFMWWLIVYMSVCLLEFLPHFLSENAENNEKSFSNFYLCGLVEKSL